MAAPRLRMPHMVAAARIRILHLVHLADPDQIRVENHLAAHHRGCPAQCLALPHVQSLRLVQSLRHVNLHSHPSALPSPSPRSYFLLSAPLYCSFHVPLSFSLPFSIPLYSLPIFLLVSLTFCFRRLFTFLFRFLFLFLFLFLSPSISSLSSYKAIPTRSRNEGVRL